MSRLAKADWTVRSVHRSQVVPLVKLFHYSSAPNTATYCHGLLRSDEEILARCWGGAIWIPPTKTAAQRLAGEDWQGVLSLTRLVVDPDAPPNAASFLLGRSMKLLDRRRWPWLVTYADTSQGHTGAIYQATNWTSEGPVAAGDTWVSEDGVQRGRKRGGRTLTRREMEAAGFTQLPGAPKIRYVHRAAT